MPQPTKAPRVGCAVIIRDEKGDVLLGRRSKQPFFGAWVLPGGGIDPFESYVETAKREAKEELGLEIEVDGLYRVAEVIDPPREHRIILYVYCRAVSGELRPSTDISEARFFGKAQVRELIREGLTTPTVSGILNALFALGEPSCPPLAQTAA